MVVSKLLVPFDAAAGVDEDGEEASLSARSRRW